MATSQAALKVAQQKGWLYFGIFVVLILAGIFVKRIMGHPEFMMFFHLPAAVFLVLAGYKIPLRLREAYRRDCQRLAENDLSNEQNHG